MAISSMGRSIRTKLSLNWYDYGARNYDPAISRWMNMDPLAEIYESSVFRVYGGDAKAGGFSWTPTNPSKVANFRDAVGLPSGGASDSVNTRQFVIEGTVKNSNIMNTRAALPLDGNAGDYENL